MRTIVLLIALLASVAQAATPMVAAGNRHNVALHADGTVRTWGDDSAGTARARPHAHGRSARSRDRRRERRARRLGVQPRGGAPSRRHGRGRGASTRWASWATAPPRAARRPRRSRARRASRRSRRSAAITLALRGDGTVWSWGENYHGQLGYDESQLVPVQVPGLPPIRAIAAGGEHSLALDVDGTSLDVGTQRLRASSATARRTERIDAATRGGELAERRVDRRGRARTAIAVAQRRQRARVGQQLRRRRWATTRPATSWCRS